VLEVRNKGEEIVALCKPWNILHLLHEFKVEIMIFMPFFG